MTLDDVRTVKETLEHEGVVPSCNLILERLGYGSKRDVVRLMRELQAEEPVDAVAVEEEAPTPLHQARDKRDQTAAAEHALGEEEQAVKQQRQALEQAVQQLAIQELTVRSDAADLARRRQVQVVSTQRAQVEAERLAVHRQRREAWQATLKAQDDYAALQGQAVRWLRRLRQAQRAVQTHASAFHRGEAREELAQALAALAALVDQAEAEALAADATLQPDWL